MDNEIIGKYFDKYHHTHLKEMKQRETIKGRMELAIEQSDGTAADIFFRFFYDEVVNCDFEINFATCIIYMPDFGEKLRIQPSLCERLRGKIIIEVDYGSKFPWQFNKDCFELQLSHKTNFSNVKRKLLQRPSWNNRASKSDNVHRYYNMNLNCDDAISLTQRILYCSFFKQRCLLTTTSKVMGSINTQNFMSDKGQLLSLRKCLLKE